MQCRYRDEYLMKPLEMEKLLNVPCDIFQLFFQIAAAYNNRAIEQCKKKKTMDMNMNMTITLLYEVAS